MIKIRQDNQWLSCIPHVNVDDVWLPCRAVYAKADGQWRRIYSRYTSNIIQFPTRQWRNEGVLQDVRISAA